MTRLCLLVAFATALRAPINVTELRARANVTELISRIRQWREHSIDQR